MLARRPFLVACCERRPQEAASMNLALTVGEASVVDGVVAANGVMITKAH
jgi:hypothetical protein